MNFSFTAAQDLLFIADRYRLLGCKEKQLEGEVNMCKILIEWGKVL